LGAVGIEFFAGLAAPGIPGVQAEQLDASPIEAVISFLRSREIGGVFSFSAGIIVIAEHGVYCGPSQQGGFYAEEIFPEFIVFAVVYHISQNQVKHGFLEQYLVDDVLVVHIGQVIAGPGVAEDGEGKILTGAGGGPDLVTVVVGWCMDFVVTANHFVWIGHSGLEAGYFYKMGFGFGFGEEFFDIRAVVNVYVGG
jgi:hypothetical protein